LGNHEYYHHTIPQLVYQLREQTNGSQVHILENDSVEIEGVKFLGCTLWTDFKLFGNPTLAALNAQMIMTDYHRIYYLNSELRKLRPMDTANFHTLSLQWLHQELNNAPSQPIVVITHHAPSALSLPAIFRTDLTGAALVSPLDDFIHQSNINLWIHGHVHKTLDYKIGNTRVICNPRGYPREQPYINFNAGLVVEV
jgi:Icc-related predicted phosphoesterase